MKEFGEIEWEAKHFPEAVFHYWLGVWTIEWYRQESMRGPDIGALFSDMIRSPEKYLDS